MIRLDFLLTPDLRTDGYKFHLYILSHGSIYQKIGPYQLSYKYSSPKFTLNPIRDKHDPGFNLRSDLFLDYYYTKGFDTTDAVDIVQFVLRDNCNSTTPRHVSSYLKDLLELI